MILKITNSARDYAWGSHSLISDYLGVEPTGKPMAELWYGTHDGSPAVLADNPSKTLLQQLDGQPLPFLLKLLAAETPLSIQAHPNAAQAKAGFARENAAGIDIGAANRNYKDDRHKPELLVALSDGFEALCGFAPSEQIILTFDALASVADLKTEDTLGQFTDIVESDGVEPLFDLLMGLSVEAAGELELGFAAAAKKAREVGFEIQSLELIFALHELYPGDIGVVISALMNHVRLSPGEAIFLPAGNIHAYLAGLGVEVMASSENVLRGGLTQKHVDGSELQSILDFAQGPAKILAPKSLANGLFAYEAPVEDFLLYRAELTGSTVMTELNLPAHAVFLCTAGEVALSNSIGEREVLRRGEAAFMAKDAKTFTLVGSGTVFIATSVG